MNEVKDISIDIYPVRVSNYKLMEIS